MIDDQPNKTEENLPVTLSDVSVTTSIAITTTTTNKTTDQDIQKKMTDLLIDQNNQTSGNESKKQDTNEKDSEYSNFMFWRNSLPSLDVSSLDSNSKLEKEQEKPSDDSSSLTKSSLISNTNSNSSSNVNNNTMTNTNSNQNNNSINYIGNLYSSSNSLSMYSNIIQQTQNGIPAHLRPIDYNQLSEELKQVKFKIDYLVILLRSDFLVVVD